MSRARAAARRAPGGMSLWRHEFTRAARGQ
jgi:hypothetical protein